MVAILLFAFCFNFGMVCPVATTADCKSATLAVNIGGSTPSHPIKSHTGKQSCVKMKDIRLGGIDKTAVVYLTDFDVGPLIARYDEDKVHPVRVELCKQYTLRKRNNVWLR